MSSFLGRIRARLPAALGPDPARLAERGDAGGLAREARSADSDRAARAVAPLGKVEPRAAVEIAPSLLARPEAGVRRATLRALLDAALARPDAVRPLGPRLGAVLAADRRREVQLAAAAVLHVLDDGGQPARAWALSLGEERLRSWVGEEEIAPLMEFDPEGAAMRLAQVLRPGEGQAAWRRSASDWIAGRGEMRALGGEERLASVEALRSRAGQGGQQREGWEALVNLVALGDPADFDLLVGRLRTAPGPALVQGVKALGLHGDPRAVPMLGHRIFDPDADPELGFALRRHAATALGRVGSPRAVPFLLPAMRMEEDEWEGRPGAGCGVIFPVRANLLWALGEVGAPSAAEAVAFQLADESGPSTGGFYLYAMDALLKMGPGAVPGIRRALDRGPPRTGESRHAAERMRVHGAEVLRRLSPAP